MPMESPFTIYGKGRAFTSRFPIATLAWQLTHISTAPTTAIIHSACLYFKMSALIKNLNAIAKEKGLEEYVSVPDYKAKGLNLYYNFNSAWSNNFDVSEQFILDPDMTPPKDFQWFYQSGGNNGAPVLESLTITRPDGTESVIDYAGKGFDPTNPTKGTTWAAYKDEDGIWQRVSADFTYDFSESDLKNVADLLKFSGKTGGMQEAINQFLKNLQVYPRGHFSRFAQYGQISMSTRV